MPAALGIGVGELVDQHQRRPPLQDGVEIHLLERASLVLDPAARHDLQPGELRLGLGAAVRLGHADHDVDPLFLAAARGRQHLVGLADAGRGAEEDLVLAARLLFRRLQKRVGRRARLSGSSGHRSSRCHCDRKASRAMLSRITLTRGSPISPRKRPPTCCLTTSWTFPSARPRALATRGPWRSAAAGVMSGSRPLADVVTRSTGTAALGFSALSLSTSPWMRSIRDFAVGPALLAAELAAL